MFDRPFILKTDLFRKALNFEGFFNIDLILKALIRKYEEWKEGEEIGLCWVSVLEF